VIDRLANGAFVSESAANAATDEQIKGLRIKTASRDHAVRTLSGGNQQKVVIGKWLLTEPRILILDEPTAGIDIGSKAEIIALVRDLAKSGKAIIVISSELSELLTAADRLIVMVNGRAARDCPRSEFDDPEPSDDEGARLQYAERQLSKTLQQAHAHV
jgi:ribose transport system ATP-binding protein